MRSIRAALVFTCSLLLLAGVAAPSHAGKPGGGGHSGGQGIQLTPEEVVPGSGEIGAAATAIIGVGRDYVSFVVTIATLPDKITEIALYQGAAGQAGTKVLRLTPTPIGIYQLQGQAACSTTLARDVSRNPAGYYVQVNTQNYPDGALRGQLH